MSPPPPPDVSSTRAPAEWSEAKPAVVPRPTYAPAATAFGITLLLGGIVTSPVVLCAGALIVVVSIVGWIGEMRHER